MLSKNQIKLIKQLNQKKYRNQNNLFFTEGVKTVNEFIKAGFTIRSMFATDQYQNSRSTDQIHLISSSELTRISNLKTPNQALCVFEIPEERTVKRNGFTPCWMTSMIRETLGLLFAFATGLVLISWYVQKIRLTVIIRKLFRPVWDHWRERI